MHQSPDVNQSTQKKKPEMILFYNKNKVGVDCFDQMARLYTTRTASRRWPMSGWGSILYIAAINTWILYKNATRKRISRRNFILLVQKLTNRKEKNGADTVTLRSQSNCVAPKKHRHCHGANCNNMTVTLCMKCNRSSCGSSSENNTRVVYVTCKKCFRPQLWYFNKVCGTVIDFVTHFSDILLQALLTSVAR